MFDVDPRIAADPRIVVDPRIAVDPRIWSDVRAFIYVSGISYPPAAIGVSVCRNGAVSVSEIVSLRFHLFVSFVYVCFVSMGCF